MSVRLSVLAILDQAPCYGNQLRAEFERRTAGAWPLNVGQVYTTLERLERDGLATRLPGNEAGQVLYAITESGRMLAQEWLTASIDRRAVPRDEFVVKLTLAMTLPGADPGALIHAQRLAIAESSGDTSEESDALADRLIRQSVALHTQAELAWLDYCESQLVVREPFGLAVEPPRRGRPSRAS